MINPWQILGIHRASDQEEIRQAYYAAAKANHPDVGGDTAKFTMINQAWTILTMPPKAFNQFLAALKAKYPVCRACNTAGYSFRTKGMTKATRIPCNSCGGAGHTIVNGSSI
jgi:DnaJ-class molecular chaperone